MSHQDINDVIAIESASLAQELFDFAVMHFSVEYEFRLNAMPAGKSASSSLHVGLGVVADAAREELHELASKVLVGMFFGVGFSVQPDQHGRIFRHREH